MIEELMRPSLRNFEPYSSARSLGLSADVYLDANELGVDRLTASGEGLNRYPDPECRDLRHDLSRVLDLDERRIFVSAGADQAIDLLIRLFCEPFQDEIAVIEPTYGVYKTSADIQGVHVRRLRLNDQFDISAKDILPRLKGVKLLFLCSPNNPTGNCLDPDQIKKVLRGFPGLVILDQAYIEFCQAEAHDFSRYTEEFPNLVVLRTFSKAWGLAGIRLGYAIAQEAITEGLKLVMPPYPVSTLSMMTGRKALASTTRLKDSVTSVVAERGRLSSELATLPRVLNVYPSSANFLLVRLKNRDFIFEKLLAEGVCVRRRSEPELPDHIRVTVGTHDENTRFLKTLASISEQLQRYPQ